MEDNESVTINNKIFLYDHYYKRLRAEDSGVPQIACPNCHNTQFQLSYGDYELIAHCNCGHTMTVYDG